jgi:hypothetical protein
VPLQTFSPVKTVLDLLNEAHQGWFELWIMDDVLWMMNYEWWILNDEFWMMNFEW